MTKRLFRTLPLLLILAGPPALLADETRAPDYSREALLQIFGDFYSPERPNALEWDVAIGRSRIHVTFLPIVLPVLLGASRADLMPDVNPFELMGTTFPSTRAMVALDDRNVAKAIRQIERRRARERKWK